ncbi:Helicase required for RNAi-mediated heterochromatin assembly 1 [Exophiala dermatitidis]
MAFEQPGGRRGGRRSGRDAVGAESEISTTTLPDGEMNTHLVERFRRGNRFPNAQNAYTSAFTNGLDLKLNTDIREYVGKQEQITQSAERDTWLSQSEIPTKEELAIPEPALPANKVNAPWRSKEKYLRTQYALLREDAVGNLREAVQDFAKSPTTGDTQKFAVYDKVYILGFTFARKGLAARIQFSTKRAGKRILWQSTKRLTSGTLVALVRANDKLTDLQGVVIAVVAARPLAGVLCQPPQIDIYFGSPADVQIDPQQEWIMIEAKQGYYEAYRHSLRALQKLSQEAFPLSNEICHFASNTEPPTYIQENPTLNLSAAAKPEEKKQYSNVDVTKPWPPPPKDTLDDTQWQALEQILTKRLAIVQGPPGCGKTYISKIAVQILQENRKDDDPPIIIAAQTNHALDQLLGHISRFDPEYIRLGGRSTNADVKQRALYEIRQRERIKLVPGGLLSKTNNLLAKQVKAMTALLGPLAKPGSDLYSTDIASAPQTLLQLGVLTDKQAKSLEDGASRWVSTVDTVDGAIRLWLDRFIMPFEVRYAQDDFGFEDAVEDDDLEFEQLRENEDATGINDEEDIELLKGPWTAVVERFTVSPCSSTDLVQAAKILDSPTTNDLWKVPEYLRKPMFAVMQSRAKAAIAAKFREAAAVYDKLVKDCLIGKWEQDSVYLSRAKIIGMTTTGLSKYRPLISALKPKIILIEEAAEVLEAPVTVACIPSLQHLILVGDHQQLQGHCSVQELEGEPLNLNISLFERLVKNNMPYKTLLRQRRMDPEFRRLISDLYPSLTDHPSVVGRPAPPWGMGAIKSFFFDHQWSEYRDESQSIYNEEEAKFIAGFYRYLVKNGLGPEHITVLTFYNGQRKKILKELKAYPELRQNYCAVKTVDSYQGEESNIVILSLARSNPEAKIGFLANNNRVCVALSRAKFGFYLFGNADNLIRGSPLWYNVITLLDSKPKRLGQVFPVQCQNHKTTLLMQYPDDWQELDGGCSKPCDANLKCGHPCPLRCHPFDHDKAECPELCNETMICGHGCEAKCSQPCLCTCDDFSRLKREEAMKGRAFPQDSRTSHLRKQFSTRNSTDRGKKSTANPTDMQSKRNPPMEPAVSRQEDARRRQTWTTFAKGGVVADDKQKADMGKEYDGVTRKEADRSGSQVPSPLLELGGVKGDEEFAMKKETVTIMQGGRNQFMHEYTPVAFNRNQDLLDTESFDHQTLEPNGRVRLATPPADWSKSEQAPGESQAQDDNKVGGDGPASTSEQKPGGDVMDALGDLLEYFRTV